MDKLVVITGPTGSGKSGLAIKLAKIFNGEIVNADSRQVYREMSVATAKPLFSVIPSEVEGSRLVDGVPHHCFDLVNPDQPFTLADWKRAALAAIKDIHARGKISFLVGGTGLYIQSIVENLDIPAVPPHKALRERLEARSKIELWHMIKDKDPETAKTIDRFNKRRMIRALEVIAATGQKFSEVRQKGPKLFEVLEIALDIPTKDLYARIDARVDHMVASGLLDEVRRLVAAYPLDLPALSVIGYCEFAPVLSLRGREAAEATSEVIVRMKFRTHAFARRQLTWFRRDLEIKWVKTDEEAEVLVADFLPSSRGG